MRPLVQRTNYNGYEKYTEKSLLLVNKKYRGIHVAFIKAYFYDPSQNHLVSLLKMPNS